MEDICKNTTKVSLFKSDKALSDKGATMPYTWGKNNRGRAPTNDSRGVT